MTDWDGLKNCIRTSSPEIAAHWGGIIEQGRNDERRWIEELRGQGFKAAHPNDGWVDRERNVLTFCYPQFNDGAGVGDLVMLGSPGDPRTQRPIRLIAATPFRFEVGTPTPRFTFEDVTL